MGCLSTSTSQATGSARIQSFDAAKMADPNQEFGATIIPKRTPMLGAGMSKAKDMSASVRGLCKGASRWGVGGRIFNGNNMEVL